MSQNLQDSPPIHRVRPRFKVETSYTVEELVAKIKMGLEKKNAPCQGKVQAGYVNLQLPQKEQHYWSPQLTVTCEETENGSMLRGLYGPRPAVWTMFIFFYSVIGFATMIIAMIGLSNITLGKSGVILWLVPVLVVAFLSLYLVAYYGKKMGHDQMVVLQKFMQESTGLTLNQDSN